MNIEEYRAMVAEEAVTQTAQTEGVEADVQVDTNPVALSEQTVQAQGEANTAPQHGSAETEAQTIPEAYEVGGVEVPVEELRNGYLRQQDYTKKTQELAQIKRQADLSNQYYAAIQSDPEFAESIARRFDLPYMTQEEAQNKDLNDKYHALLLEREIDQLKAKYDDVDTDAVLRTAYDKRLGSFEDAYLLNKANSATAPNVDEMKEQIRQEVLRDLQSNVDTSTTIGTGGTVKQVTSNVPDLSPQELRVAQNMKMSATDYAKWKNAK